MRNKKGISLIVLVITIIVMIILAAAVVVSLNNTGIIGKANTAVDKTNMKQIESLASLAWADAFMEGARTQEELQAAVDEALKYVDTSKYDVIVTDKGVTVVGGDGANDNTTPTTPEETIEPGLYDDAGNMVASWSTLESYGLDITIDYEYANTDYPTALRTVIKNNSSLSSGTHLVIDNDIEYIGKCSCSYTSLKKITIPSSVKTISNTAFAYSTLLEEVVLNEGLETMREGAFLYAPKLSKISIPSTLKTLETGVFWLTAITTFNVPATLTTIDFSAITYCTSLDNVNVDEAHPTYKSVNGIVYTKDDKTLVLYPGGRNSEFIIPEGIEIIGKAAFRGGTITKVTIPSSVTTLSNSAFNECEELTEVVFADDSKLTTIGTSVFNLNRKLTSIEIPEGVTTMGASSLYCCESLTTVTLPSTLTSIGYEALAVCGKLTNITIRATTPPTTASDALRDCESITTITVPAGSGDAYKAASEWSNYSSAIVEALE